VRVSVLAGVRHLVDSRVEVHRIYAVTAVDGVCARVVVSLDHVSADSGANLIVVPSIVSAYEVRAAPAVATNVRVGVSCGVTNVLQFP
jgi:hypothetical protein